MAENKPQNFANHASFDLLYHVVLFALILFTLVMAVIYCVQQPGIKAIWVLFGEAALVIIFIKLRTYPLKNQDRIIRLEERLRLTLLLPENLRPRIHELSESQLVAIRFVPDEEIPEVFKKAVEEKLTNKQIKALVNNWRADHFRI
jgi:c-di-AMP phosphodiesterase-like protein